MTEAEVPKTRKKLSLADLKDKLAKAEKHGGLDGVDTFLRNLSESFWFHVDE